MSEVKRVTAPYEGIPFKGWDDTALIPAPLKLHRCIVKPEWTDYNGHMSESIYLLVMGDHSDAFFRFFGIDEAYRATGFSLYTIETRIHNYRECSEGDEIKFSLTLLDLDQKRLHIFHEMHNAETAELLATGEQLLMHVDMKAGKSAVLPDDLYHRLSQILKAHSVLPKPKTVGTVLGIKRKENPSS
ncbi:MAG: 4-hydroxybenzoyl-CoA thioesterase [Alphaproteobacteria bacterium]|jgi:acyl-CoA thioester hydrolase|nr:4-hydroxybenzoyl-CoA thioesterase [Alphaproteobacteria bacterium]